MATPPLSSAPPNNCSSETAISDEILDELYAFREAYAAQFDYDLEKMFADLHAFAQAHPITRPATIQPVMRKPLEE